MPEYKIIKTKRRTISIAVSSAGEITVRAPIKCADNEINKFIDKNKNWIDSKLALFNNTVSDITGLKNKEYTYIFNRRYLLAKAPIKKIKITDDNTIIIPDNDRGENKFICWMKNYALEYFINRCEELHKEIYNIIEKNYKEIKIINSKTKWGACDIKGVLYFNWRAIMLDPEVIDYLIYHEMCHLKYMNHSKEYWDTVKRLVYPKKYRKLLKEKNYYILLYR